jgi:hypothetical protein
VFYNFILQPKYILKASYFSPQILNITAVQDVRHSLSYWKQVTRYFGKTKLNVTGGKE